MADEPLRPRGVLETALYVDDLDAAARFYGDVLGLAEHSREDDRHVFFRCGPGMLLLFLPRASAKGAFIDDQLVPPHGAAGPGHAAFRVRGDELAEWRRRLSERGVAIESEVAWPGGGRSIYLRDPAGNSLELATADLWGLGED